MSSPHVQWPLEPEAIRQRTEGIQQFPARMDFASVSAVTFRSEAPAPVLDEKQRDLRPSSWSLDMKYRPVGSDRYLVSLRLATVWDGLEEESKPPYNLSLEIVAGVCITGKIPDELKTQWIERGTRYLLMPYGRATVAQFMQSTGFPVPHVPLVAVPILYGLRPSEDDAPLQETETPTE